MGAFLYKLEQADGTPADPPLFRAAVPNGVQATRFTCRTGRSASSASETTTPTRLRCS
jgi:hypothetical protein